MPSPETPRERAEKFFNYRIMDTTKDDVDALAAAFRSCAADALEAAADQYDANKTVTFVGWHVAERLQRMAAEARKGE